MTTVRQLTLHGASLDTFAVTLSVVNVWNREAYSRHCTTGFLLLDVLDVEPPLPVEIWCLRSLRSTEADGEALLWSTGKSGWPILGLNRKQKS